MKDVDEKIWRLLQEADGKYRVLVLMGSKSDSGTMQHTCQELYNLGVSYLALVTSAHRTWERLAMVAASAEQSGFSIIIAGAGGSAHLGGMSSAMAPLLPVLVVAVPSKSNPINDQSAIGSSISMPAGCPLAFMGIGEAAAKNAALQAAAILGISDPALRQRLRDREAEQQAAVPMHPEFTDGLPVAFPR